MNNVKKLGNRQVHLDELEITRYVLRDCSDDERQRIETHLSECPECIKEVAYLKQAEATIRDDKKWCDVPAHLYHKEMRFVREMIAPARSILTIFLRCVHGQWQIIRHTGNLMPRPVLASRGDISKRKAKLPPIIKEMNGYRVEVSLCGYKEGTIDCAINLKNLKAEDFISQTECVLWDEKTQRPCATVIHEKDILFQDILPGKYSIQLIVAKKALGTINLDLTQI